MARILKETDDYMISKINDMISGTCLAVTAKKGKTFKLDDDALEEFVESLQAAHNRIVQRRSK